MSGVIAVFNRDGRPVTVDALETLHLAGAHRAVDGHKSWSDGPAGLVHQHFRVWLDDDATSQPFASRDGRFVLSGDLRLDGRSELCHKLGVHTSEALPDPHLVLRAYEKWGADCVEHLRGDFAFAVWDETNQSLFCARDALGVRDLAYFMSDRLFVAASEVAQVLAHQEVARHLNEGRLGEYLAGSWQEHHETFFEDVFYCPPAHCLLVSKSSFRLWRYWDLDPGRKIAHRREGDYAEEFCGLLTDAIGDRLSSTEPFAVSLSGGPDSAALAALARRARPSTRIKSFSYVFDRFPSCDERRYIQTVVDRCQLDATYINGDELWPLKDLESWEVFPDFPGQDPYVRLPMAIADAARGSGCRVILNGHYSDLLFHGGQFLAADLLSPRQSAKVLSILANNLRFVSWKRDVLRNGLWMRTPGWIRSAVRRIRGSDRIATGLEMLEPGFVSRSGLSDRIHKTGGSLSGVRSAFEAKWRHLSMSILAQGAASARRLYNSRATELVDPFWDRRLVEYVMAIPAHMLARPGVSKYLLRKATSGVVPDEVRERRDKTSLYELFCEGLLHREKDTILGLLDQPGIVERGIVRSHWLSDQMTAGSDWSDYGHPLWRCLSAELWLRDQQ